MPRDFIFFKKNQCRGFGSNSKLSSWLQNLGSRFLSSEKIKIKIQKIFSIRKRLCLEGDGLLQMWSRHKICIDLHQYIYLPPNNYASQHEPCTNQVGLPFLFLIRFTVISLLSISFFRGARFPFNGRKRNIQIWNLALTWSHIDLVSFSLTLQAGLYWLDSQTWIRDFSPTKSQMKLAINSPFLNFNRNQVG